MRKLDAVIVSSVPPTNTNVLWYDGKNLQIFNNGKWNLAMDVEQPSLPEPPVEETKLNISTEE